MTDETKRQLLEIITRNNPQVQINIDCTDVSFNKNQKARAEHANANADDVEQLHTEPAQALWQIAIANGWVDNNLQPRISHNKAAILASVMADALNLTPRWAPFENLWGITNLSNKLSHAQICTYYPATQKEFEKALI